MRRTEYRCPYCAQISSRRWNMKIHIQRRHSDGIEQQHLHRSGLPDSSSSQIFSSVGNSLYKSNYEYVNDNENSSYVHQKHLQNPNVNYYQNAYYYSPPFQEQGQSREQQEKDSSAKRRDDISELHEMMRQLVEIRNMSTQFQSSPSSFPIDQLPHIMSMFSMQQLPDINAKLNWLKDYAATLDLLDNMSRNNKNIGFRGHICNNCFHSWVQPVYSNSKDMISLAKSTKPSMHTCNPEKVAEAQINVQDIQSKKDASEDALIDLLVLLIFLLWGYFPQNKIWLKTEELIISPAYSSSESDEDYASQLHEDDVQEQEQQQHIPMSFGVQREQIHREQINCNFVDIDLDKIEKSHWAYRGIAEAQKNGKSSILIDSGKLKDFVKLVKGSYGICTEHIDGSTRHFFMYLSFKDN